MDGWEFFAIVALLAMNTYALGRMEVKLREIERRLSMRTDPRSPVSA